MYDTIAGARTRKLHLSTLLNVSQISFHENNLLYGKLVFLNMYVVGICLQEVANMSTIW